MPLPSLRSKVASGDLTPGLYPPGSVDKVDRVLKVKGMRDAAPGKRLFVIEVEGEPASPEDLQRVAEIAGRLLAENELPGEFGVFDRGLLELNILASERTFFHDGIVFAALDAVNNPEKNPTITQPAVGD
jgi:hypothetical protein